ncbi:hypothetical protein FI667_g17324, partial [Globisporangium splendens]
MVKPAGELQRPKWTHEEETLLLRAWRDVLRGIRASSSRAQDMRHVDARTLETFVAYGGSAARSRSAVEGKQRRLLTMYRFVARQKDWFAMRAETQQQLYAEHSGTTELVKLDRHMCSILAEIDRNRRLKVSDTGSERLLEPYEPTAASAATTAASAVRATPRVTTASTEATAPAASTTSGAAVSARTRERHPWTDGEIWLLITAWRQVVSENSYSNGLTRFAEIYERFCVLTKERRKTTSSTMPERNASSLLAKRAKLVCAYNLINEYNQQQLDDAEDGTMPRNWFSLSAAKRKEYLARQSVNPRYFVPDISRDQYNALAIIMRQETLSGGVDQQMTPVGADGTMAGIASYSDSDDDDSGWEILPSNFGSETSLEAKHHYPSPAGDQVSSSLSSNSKYSDGSRIQAKRNVHGETAKSRKNKRKYTDEVDDYQRLLKEVKKEMELYKKEYAAMLGEIQEETRKLRKERTKIGKLIEGQQNAWKREKASRKQEQEEWEIEKERMLHKLSKMRDRYKKATKKLKLRLAQL